MKKMFEFIGLFFISMSFCCTPASYKSQAQSKKELVELLEKETVALVSFTEDDKIHTYCSGVWISENKILTARHCIEDLDKDLPMVTYATLGEKEIYLAAVVAVEENDDLALLEALPNSIPKHPYAPIGHEAWDGEHVNIVGHPIGMVWSYTDGVVSSTRTNLMTETVRWTLQITSAAWMGNSGGGAFDDEGRLLGICSFLSRKAPLMTFFSHPKAINEFLNEQH